MKDTVRNIPSSIVFKDENVIVIVFDFGMSIADSIFWIFMGIGCFIIYCLLKLWMGYKVTGVLITLNYINIMQTSMLGLGSILDLQILNNFLLLLPNLLTLRKITLQLPKLNLHNPILLNLLLLFLTQPLIMIQLFL